MKRYKPEFMGKILEPDNTTKMTDFVQNKYDSFSKIYESCRDQSEQINDIKNIDKDSSDKSELVVKISTDTETLEKISENIKDNEKIKLDNDIISAMD
jgi:hypothetical protein